jgi:L-lysine 2,3-aminomutase
MDLSGGEVRQSVLDRLNQQNKKNIKNNVENYVDMSEYITKFETILYNVEDETLDGLIFKFDNEVIRIEMLDYFLSNMKEGNELTDAIERYFIPAINELGEMGVFSGNIFYQFMYELVGGLLKKELLKFEPCCNS